MRISGEALRNVESNQGSTAPGGWLRWMLAGYVICLPIQIELSEPSTVRVGVSDLFLVAAAVTGIAHIRFRREAWRMWHIALMLLIPLWTLAKQPETGPVYRWVLVNKTAGIMTLFLLYLMLTSLPATWEMIRWLSRLFVGSVIVTNTISTFAF